MNLATVEAPVLGAVQPLAFITADSAMGAYRLAQLTGAPADFKAAAHKLAHVVRQGAPAAPRETVRLWLAEGEGGFYRWGYEGDAYQFSHLTREECRAHALAAHPGAAVVWCAPPAPTARDMRQGATEAWCAGDFAREAACDAAAAELEREAPKARKPRATRKAAGGVDLSATLAPVPRRKEAVGAFTCRWADGSETYVSAVVYHTAKPDTRWAAAAQAADRLRRMRAAREAGAAEAFPGRVAFGPVGVVVDSADWHALTAVRPLPELAEIMCDLSAEVHTAAPGFGGGDAAEAARIGARLRKRVQLHRDLSVAAPQRPAEPSNVVRLPTAPAILEAAHLQVRETAAEHARAQKAYVLASRPHNGGNRATAERCAELYAAECAAFSARRAAERELAALAA